MQKWNSLTYLYLIMLNRGLNHTLPAKQSGFQGKSVTFVTSIPIPKARWAEVGQTYIW